MTTLPTPKITAHPKPGQPVAECARWTIDFGNGATAEVTRTPDRFEWSVDSADGDRETGFTDGQRRAFESTWAVAAQDSAPASVGDFEARRMVQLSREADTVTAWAKILRRSLKMRTGLAWSVTIGKGTAAEWIKITATPKRRKGLDMSPHDSALLAGVLGVTSMRRQGVSVSPDGGERGRVLRAILGSQPEFAASAGAL